MMVSCLVVAYCFNNLSYSIIKIVRIISLVHKTYIHIFTTHNTPLASIQLKSIYQQLVSQLLLAAPALKQFAEEYSSSVLNLNSLLSMSKKAKICEVII